MSTSEVIDRGVHEKLIRLGGNKLLRDLIGIFADRAPMLVSEAKEGAAADDADVVERRTHALKGSAANLGTPVVYALCGELEQRSRELKDADSADVGAAMEAEIRPKLGELEASLEVALAALAEIKEGLSA